MRALRVYVDTSVIGGCLDDEFSEPSMRLVGLSRAGRVVLLVSDVVISELADAPEGVRSILPSLPAASIEVVPITTEVNELRDAYLAAGVVAPRWIDDAAHVVAATISRADAIVSWNFKHIVRLDRIKAYNQVNLAHGYGILTILSPLEVAIDEPD